MYISIHICDFHFLSFSSIITIIHYYTLHDNINNNNNATFIIYRLVLLGMLIILKECLVIKKQYF